MVATSTLSQPGLERFTLLSHSSSLDEGHSLEGDDRVFVHKISTSSKSSADSQDGHSVLHPHVITF